MRLKRNLLVGFGGTLWAAVVGIALVPFYLRFLGIEAYGLVGFFLAMQAVFQVLDLGLAPTISREVSRCQAMSMMASARNLMRTLAVFYWGVGALLACAIYATASWIGSEWLSARNLSSSTIVISISLMGIVAGLRFPIGLYAGALQGAHRLADVSIVNALMTTSAALGTVIVLIFVSRTIQAFFIWQIVVALLHVVIIRWAAWRALGGSTTARIRFGGMRDVWRFSAGMGVVAVLGMVLTQLDKLVLTRVVTLEEFGHYTLAGMAARVLALFATPVFSVIYPRLSALVAIGAESAIMVTYRNGTRLLLALLMPLAMYVCVFAVDIFTLWTGDASLARSLQVTVILLVIGAALNATMIFPYALQLAYGRSRTPAMITGLLILGFVPLLLWLVPRWGIAGAAAAWAILNLAYIPLGAALTHRTLLKGVGRAWIMSDVAMPCGIAIIIVGSGGYALRELEWPAIARVGLGAGLVPLASLAVMATSASIRKQVYALRTWFAPSRASLTSVL